MNKIQKLIFITFILIFACAVGLGAWIQQGTVSEAPEFSNTERLTLSAQNGFYDKSFIVYAQTSHAGDIYYTLDGSEPSKENAMSFLYGKEGIEILCEEKERVYNLKCRAFYEDGTVSDVLCRSFIVGNHILQRYDLPVLNVFGDPYEFYNYEDGIMVFGRLDEEFLEANPYAVEWVEEKTFPSFGNRYQTGREAEKPVYMTLFDKDGDVIAAQNCGFRIYGGYSRSKNQPSFRLYARSEYDLQNDFDYVFFENQYRGDDSTLLDKYQRLVVRNNGNDNGYAFIRNELSTRLAIDAGFPDVQASRPICVYLNGEYYGILWLMANFDDEYFEQTYGEYTGEMYIFEGAVHDLEVSDDEEEAYKNIAEEYEEKQDFFAKCDLNNQENWAALNDFLDVENYLQYMAIQHYIANNDTLTNNYRIYRYYDESGNYTEDTVFEGRFRFLLFDLDYSFGLTEQAHYVESLRADLTNERVNSDLPEHKLFANIMSRKDCRDIYIRYFLSDMNYYYSESYVTPILQEMHEERYHELEYAISQGLYLENFCAPDVNDMENVEAELEVMYTFMSERPSNAFYDLVKAFGAFTPYSLILQNNTQAMVSIDYADVTMESFSGIYLLELPPVLTVTPQAGWKFSHWLVNGEQVLSKELVIEEHMVQEYVANISCVCVPDESADLKITAVKPKGGEDYIEVTNYSQQVINLGNYTLSDSGGERVSKLPAIFLAPLESRIIYCKNYTGFEALGQPGVNFNIRAGETISLYKDGQNIDNVLIYDLGSENNILKMNKYTRQFREIVH